MLEFVGNSFENDDSGTPASRIVELGVQIWFWRSVVGNSAETENAFSAEFEFDNFFGERESGVTVTVTGTEEGREE